MSKGEITDGTRQIDSLSVVKFDHFEVLMHWEYASLCTLIKTSILKPLDPIRLKELRVHVLL